jgi:CHAT domain-containing protein
LHGLPWNALLIGKDNRPLVEQAVPVLVPSLRSALALWSHSTKSQEISRQPGLVVGVSQFMEKYPSLPAIEEELRTFETLSSNGGKILRNEAASWPALLQLAQSDLKKGLARFNFFHLASHFFSDSISGQLSGVALWGETIYQDQLRALAPLPELVTLSGCSSIFSRTYAGDEHIGLPTTCLMAGAESVIGSNWPIHDESAAEFMKLFYRHYQSGLSPAIALAQTQREFIRAQKETASWAGYSCIGKP